jgi:hypothetical protein
MPRTLADRVLELGGAASCPLMAGSPSLPRKRLFWGSRRSCSIPEVTSGARAVGARTRGDFAHPRGSVRRTRGEARGLLLTDVPTIRSLQPCASVDRASRLRGR